MEDRDRLCKIFVSKGSCSKGAQCAYRHPTTRDELIAARILWVAARVTQRRSDQAQVTRAPKTERFSEFGLFVRTIFPLAEHVVDVAGGKGLVAQYLWKRGVAATLVDPRATCPNGVTGPSGAKCSSGITCSDGGTCSGGIVSDTSDISDTWHILRTEFTDPPNAAVDALLASLDPKRACVVGLHPDAATEPIVDVCLRRRIPFAVVPCCTFPDTYADHKVNSTEKLIDYLKSKNIGIRETHLAFEGRNRTLYWNPAYPE
ncbi:hypothetical protein HK100_002633 [Physocladia obscura]|uniref:C3H1-type domain-containing protein n=1 Tax=Physocladia obscura TaxID=109957 RepID=A0AAD5XA38_9FUNG|nr:hypothetical protein HK100_002633 [Physocladia obscura]